MKRTRNLITAGIITLLLSGCVVYSFYPLYTSNDLFPNDILLGEWFEMDDQEVVFTNGDDEWIFEHLIKGEKEDGVVDSSAYILTVKTIEKNKEIVSEFRVHVIELGGYLFLDFYLEEYGGDEVTLATFHIVPVHTFAKLTVKEDRLIINWYDQDWLEDLIKENKIRIHHEDNGDYILLTAKPKELQKFVTKYVNSEEAFEDGLEVVLHRK